VHILDRAAALAGRDKITGLGNGIQVRVAYSANVLLCRAIHIKGYYAAIDIYSPLLD